MWAAFHQASGVLRLGCMSKRPRLFQHLCAEFHQRFRLSGPGGARGWGAVRASAESGLGGCAGCTASPLWLWAGKAASVPSGSTGALRSQGSPPGPAWRGAVAVSTAASLTSPGELYSLPVPASTQRHQNRR